MFDFLRASARRRRRPRGVSRSFGRRPAEKLPRYLLIGLLAALVVAVAATCWYTVDDKQQAVGRRS